MTQPTPAHPATMAAQLDAPSTPSDAPRPAPILATARLILRPMYTKDAPSMTLAANSPAIAKYMMSTFPNPYTIDAAISWIAMNLAMPHPANYSICEASNPDIIIGGIGLKPGADVNRHTAEVGFWVGEKYWGKGYTTEALAGFTKWSLQEWEGKDGQRLKRLWGGVFEGNHASMRCFEKCGYSKEGVMKGHVEKNGVIMDQHIFGFLC
jgi:ribosomal-protein-alanine N-acetyltransferase